MHINFKLKGMSREILDSAIVQQFKKYLKIKNKVLEELQMADLKEEVGNYLEDFYPGVKSPPHKMAELMSSRDPDKSLKSLALVNPEEYKTCNQNYRRKRSVLTCPDSNWFQNTLGDCIKFYDVLSLRPEAVTTCNSISLNGNSARLLRFIDTNRATVIWNDMADGRFPGFDMSADVHWKELRFWIDAVKTSDYEAPGVVPPDGVIWEADSCPVNIAGVFLNPSLNFKMHFPNHSYVTANAQPDQAGMYKLGQIKAKVRAKFFCIFEGTGSTTMCTTTTNITEGIISQIFLVMQSLPQLFHLFFLSCFWM